MSPETENTRAPDFGRRVYGETSWGYHAPPLPSDKIDSTFSRMRETYRKAGFSDDTLCSAAVLYIPGTPEASLEHADVVRRAAEKYKLVPVTTIFRPGGPSMIGGKEKRKLAVQDCKEGIKYAMIATPEGLPRVVNGPFHISFGTAEIVNRERQQYLDDCLKEVDEELLKADAFGGLEPLRKKESRMPLSVHYWIETLCRIKSERLGLLVDTIHFYEGNGRTLEKMFEAIEFACRTGLCNSVHLSNLPNRVAWERGEIAPHTARLLTILKDNNCNVTVEYEGFNESMDKGLGLTRESGQENQQAVNERSMANVYAAAKELGLAA